MGASRARGRISKASTEDRSYLCDLWRKDHIVRLFFSYHGFNALHVRLGPGSGVRTVNTTTTIPGSLIPPLVYGRSSIASALSLRLEKVMQLPWSMMSFTYSAEGVSMERTWVILVLSNSRVRNTFPWICLSCANFMLL